MDKAITCAACKKKFFRSANRLKESKKLCWRAYCSRPCQSAAKSLGRIKQCGNPDCSNAFYRSRKEIKKVDKSYCSASCSASVNNRKRIESRGKVFCLNSSCKREISSWLTYCSSECFHATRSEYQKSDLMDALKVEAQKLGRVPSKREFGKKAYICVRAFGSWNKSLLAAGLKPHRSHDQRMYKRTNTTAIDGHRCDSVSEALVDDWLTKNRIPHIRNATYPETNCKADWGISRKIFIEYFGLADDCPRYDNSINQKRELCRKHGITLYEIFACDLYPTIKLDSKLESLLS